MQFRGYSLPVHHCSGTIGPSPCPISEALIRPRDLFRLLAVGMCHFLPVYYLGIVFLGRVEGQNITMPFQRRGSCIFHWRRRAWLTIWDRVKSHGTVRLMHQTRVTCELHDSYFRSMTIKHAIPRTTEVTHPDGQLWGDIEWVIELLYNSVKTGSQLVWRRVLEIRPVGDKMW